MENASKALLIAAEVLISIIVISALVLMFNSLSDYQKVNEKNEEEATVIAFNNEYEAYNRDDVRGNDLYSLINRVIDYNKRKSTQGTGNNDEGQYLAYEPITLNISFTSDMENKFTYDGNLRLLLKNTTSYEINSTENPFKTMINTITSLEQQYSASVLINLASNITSIFNYKNVSEWNSKSEYERKQIIYDYNNTGVKDKLDVDQYGNYSKTGEKILDKFENVCKYYEYLQFTRAHFKCTNVLRNKGTGRIVRMEFEFTGKIN